MHYNYDKKIIHLSVVNTYWIFVIRNEKNYLKTADNDTNLTIKHINSRKQMGMAKINRAASHLFSVLALLAKSCC